MNGEEGKRKNKICRVIAWYHNNKKLYRARTYDAEVLYHNNQYGRDISLMRFKPDWKPEYLPIADKEWNYTKRQRLHSVGCDNSREVAHYDVEVVGLRNKGDWPDLVTTRNSPRRGRSGGGLSTEYYFVGVCWGTSDYSGNGNGFFIPVKTIREYNERNGYGWLNDVGQLARQIPIRDRNNPQKEYPRNYIPVPQR